MINRPYGVSIATAATLVGKLTFLFSQQGADKVIGAADTLGFGL